MFFFPMTRGDQGRKPIVKQKQKQKTFNDKTNPKGNAERKKREKDEKTSDSLLL
jgi:hypothetical protein